MNDAEVSEEVMISARSKSTEFRGVRHPPVMDGVAPFERLWIEAAIRDNDCQLNR